MPIILIILGIIFIVCLLALIVFRATGYWEVVMDSIWRKDA